MLNINEDFIIFYKESCFFAADTRNQRLFKITKEAFLRLADWAYQDKVNPDAQVDELLKESEILTEIPQINSEWRGDSYSRFFYNLTRNKTEKIPPLNKREFIKHYIEVSKNSSVNLSKLDASTPFKHKKKIALPEPQLNLIETASLLDSLFKRKTTRNFNSKPITLDELTVLLYLCFGEIHGKEWQDFKELNISQFGMRKSSPSASGLHACSAYLVVLNVTDLTPGIYFYDASDHSLREVSTSIDLSDVISFVCDQFWIEGISVGIFVTLDLRKVWVKDPRVRGLPVAYAEAGHFSQTLQLVAAGLDLQTWITGTFRDDEVNKKLEINSDYSFPAFFVGVGHGSNNSIPKEFLELEAE